MITPTDLSQVSIANLTVGVGEPVALIEAAGAAGFGFVGLALRSASSRPLAREIIGQPETIRAIKAACAATGVGIFDVEAFVLRPGTEIADLRPALALGAEFGASHISVIGAEPAASGASLPEGERIELFGRLCDEAASFGLQVGVEFMRYRDIPTLQDALALIAAAGRDRAGIIFDMLHFQRTGGAVAELAQVPADRIAYVQICDAAAEAPPPEALSVEARTGRLHPGDGVIALDALLDVLPDGKRLVVETPVRADAGLSLREKTIRSAERARAFLAARAGRR